MDRESVLEAGFLLVVIGFVAGFGVLVGGRLLGEQHRQRGRADIVERGSVPTERHQHLSPSAR
jgi:hypothetical protein